jgi:hypothetical protein
LRNFQHQQREREGHRSAVLADQEGNTDDRDHTQRRLQCLHEGKTRFPVTT